MKKQIKKIHWNAHQSCNMNCPFCYLWRPKDIHILSTDEVVNLITQAANSKIEWFVFGGGDPLMRKDLFYLTTIAKQLGLKIDIQTNGILLTNKLLSALCKNIDRIGLSFEGEDELTHDYVRDYKGHFRVVHNALENCQKFNMPTIIRTTVCKLNLGKIGKLGQILSHYSVVKKWKIREFVPLERGARNEINYLVSRKEFLEEFLSIKNKNIGINKNFPIVRVTSNKMNNCYYLISSNGNVYTHPNNRKYQSVGKFPEESLKNLLERINYCSALEESENIDIRMAG